MYGTLKKIFAFAGSKKGLLKKSLLFSFLSGLFSAMQFAALFVVIGALVSDNRKVPVPVPGKKNINFIKVL